MIVLLDHWRNFLFVDFPQVQAHRNLLAVVYVLATGGHQAVVIFFVLSGYLISGSVFRMLDRGSWSWGRYLIHRLMRLWVVLIPGLMLCAMWDSIGIHLRRAPALYGGAGANHLTGNVGSTLEPRIFVENLLFLQTIVGPVFGSDGVLWSLANEFWYYMLFPLGLFVVYRHASLLTRVWSGALLLIVGWFVGGGIILMSPIWLAGTLLCFLPTLKLGRAARWSALPAYAALFFFCARFDLYAPRLTHLPAFAAFSRAWIFTALGRDYLLAAGTVIFLWMLLSANQESKPSAFQNASHRFAGFSYTLYVVHVPFLLVLTSVFLGDKRWIPTAPHLMEAVGLLVVAIAYAYGVALLTEFRTDEWRRWVERRLGFSA